MEPDEQVNILLVDDQPAKLMSYEVVLASLGENLMTANSAREALEQLLKNEIAVLLVDVCMPELDGFELVTMIREHPRFQRTAIIFVSAVMASEPDRLRGYAVGAVDFVQVPVVPELLRAKVKVFAELYRKTRQLERLNAELEQRVDDRTAALALVASKLRESEQRRNAALAAGRMGSWDWDIASGNHHWDEGQHAIFGSAPDDGVSIPERIEDLIHPGDKASLRTKVFHALKSGLPFEAEFRITLRGGDTRWCVAHGAASRDALGKPVRLSGVTQDITAKKQAEMALSLLNEQLEHRVEERTREREEALAQLFEAQKLDTIGQLTGGVAHDFNNLLMAILGSLEVLRKRLTDTPRDLRLVDNAIEGAKRGAALTQRLLAFARRQELKPEIVDIPELVDGMANLLERACGPTIEIRNELPPALPSVRVDRNQFELALLNLVVNARDAMPFGGTITLTGSAASGAVDGAVPEPLVAVGVVDTGMGMDEDTISHAAEPFFTTKGIGKGTGLGLSMVHGFVVQSGGKLTITSVVGSGTTIEMRLPAVVGERAAQSLPAPPTDDGVDPVRPHASTILVVDDDGLVRMGTVAMLEDLGHTVLEASSGAEALEILQVNTAIEVVVTDHAMPGMSGVQLIDKLQRTKPGVKTILATGYADIANAGDILTNIPRLSKPFTQDSLIEALAALA
ncbi:MAG: response regulator [Rhizobiales bacterium]|nr:response regulator [Hyphomicrobiales bacterium]